MQIKNPPGDDPPTKTMLCSQHSTKTCSLVGYDKDCRASCLLCVDCIDDANYKVHKKDAINHKTINLQKIEAAFQALRSKNAKEIARNRECINNYFQSVEREFMKKLQQSKQKLYELSDMIMLTEITQDNPKLRVLEDLFFSRFDKLKCSDVLLIAKDLINFKPGAVSIGYEEFNSYISEQLPKVELEIDLYSKLPKYGEVTLDSSRKDIDYPLFHRERPPPPPPPPPKKSPPPPPPPPPKVQSPPPRKYVKPWSVLDLKQFRGMGLKKLEFGESKVMNRDEAIHLLGYFSKLNIKSIDLLYRASEEGFSVSKFHQVCDNHPNTVVIIRTQFNKIIGGYTPLPWKSTTGTMHADVSRESFLFSLSLKQKMDLIDPKSAIFNYSLYGPCFGAGSDLAIFPDADTERNSYSDFPYSYNNAYNHESNQQTTTFFTGQTKGKNFIVREWEVWKLRLT